MTYKPMMPQTLPKQPAAVRPILAALALLSALHLFRIVAGRAFPGAWNDVGGILVCALIAYPSVTPVRWWLARGRWALVWFGWTALFVASAYCSFVLGQ
jgi:hypothetical protein